jgi:hypothetical protein
MNSIPTASLARPTAREDFEVCAAGDGHRKVFGSIIG